MAIKNTFALWRPPGGTIEAEAAVLSTRWSAARSQPEGLFWPNPTSWLRQQARRLADNGRVLSEHYLAPLTIESGADT